MTETTTETRTEINEARELTLCTYHFPSMDNRFNGRRTCIYAGKGPKYISLIVMDSAELTITRVPADAEIKFLTSEQADPEKALELFRETARTVGCTKPVAVALGIEWPPIMKTKAQESFEQHAEERAVQTQTSVRAEEKAAKAKAKADAKAKAAELKAKKEAERQAQLEAERQARAANKAPRGEGKIARIRAALQATAVQMFGEGVSLADLDRKQSADLVAAIVEALPDQNVATIKTQYARLRAVAKGVAAAA